MSVERCPKCKAPLAVGAWPFCGGDPAKHEPVHSRNEDALCTAVFVNKSGDVWVPSSPSDPTPRGYARKELKNRSEVNAFLKGLDARSREANQRHLLKQSERAGRRQEALREAIGRLRAMSPQGREYADALTARLLDAPRYTRQYQPGNHFKGWE